MVTTRYITKQTIPVQILPDQQPVSTTLQNLPDSADTLTVQNISKLSINNPQSFTVTNDSNVLQFPVRNVTQKTTNDQSQDNTCTLSTIDTAVTQPFQTQQGNNHHLEIMTHLLFHHNILLKRLHIILLNKVPLKQMAQIHFKFNLKHNFKLLLNQDNQFYKLIRTLQLKPHKLEIYNLAYSSILFIQLHFLSILPLEIFPDLHYKLFLITHYRTVLITHNTLPQLLINKTIINPFSTSHPYIIPQNMTQNTQSQTSDLV